MKFTEFLNEDADDALKNYIKDPEDKSYLNQYADELTDKYGNDKPLKLYRGLNFDTKEEYDNFIKSISDGKITIDNNASSWTRRLGTARQFAKTKPSYMEFMTKEKMKLISDSKKNNEFVVGYKGVIIEIDIGKNEGVDTSLTDYKAEDEVIIFKGTYKCKYYDLVKNSDRIKTEGLQAILDEIENQNDLEDKEKYNFTMLNKIINDHKHELTPRMKSFFDKRFLNESIKFNFSKNNSILHDNKKVIVVVIDVSPTIKYGKEIFNKESLNKFYAKHYDEHKNKLLELKNLVDENKDIDIDLHATNPGQWFAELGLKREFNSLFTHIGDSYREKTSKKNIDNINKLKGKEQDKAIDDFAKSIKDLLKSIG